MWKWALIIHLSQLFYWLTAERDLGRRWRPSTSEFPHILQVTSCQCSLCLWFSLQPCTNWHPLNRRLHINSKVTSSSFPLLGISAAEHDVSRCHNVLPPTWRQHKGRSQRFNTVHSATESAYFGSLKHCQSGFGNVGIAFVAVAPVAVVLAAVAVFAAAAAGCIPQCFAVGH